MPPRTATDERGRLADDHPLSAWARAYAERVLETDRWPLSGIDDTLISWTTSTRSRRRNGCCRYDADGRCTVTLGEHVRDRGGYRGCKPVVRHELVHVWQHQHRDAWAVETGAAPAILGDDLSRRDRPEPAFRVEPGHGPSFRAWVDPLELEGRFSTPYERTRDVFTYVVECPACGQWWGRHRLCRTVRQAAHGAVGQAGYRFCTDCEVLIYVRSADRYLDHGDHADETIRSFADGDTAAAPSTSIDRLQPTRRPVRG